jgi:Icc-related predicted phosphoesterase
MAECIFVSDLHGHTDRYEKLFGIIRKEKPDALFVGGDIMPSPLASKNSITERYFDFVDGSSISQT